MTGSRDALTLLRDGARVLAFGNPLYNLTLAGHTPSALAVVPPDPWMGNAAVGDGIRRGCFSLAGQTLQLPEPPTSDDFWRPRNATPAFLQSLQSFDWMRDLRALGGDAARRQARALVYGWAYCNAVWNGYSWTPDRLGARIANWIGLHDFFCASADEGFRFCVFDSLCRQTRHLARVAPGQLQGAALLVALKGLVYGGLALKGNERLAHEGLQGLVHELPSQILADGCHVERNPSTQLLVLRHLIDIRSILRVSKTPVPEVLQHAIDRMTPALRFFRHGDGGLGLFNGGREEEPLLVDTVLAQADARGRPMKSATASGFERIMVGRSIVMLDVGYPAPSGSDQKCHAGVLSFEFSVGKERIIVNCGAHPAVGGPWRAALAGTAAHSTLSVAETNSSEVLPDGGIGRRPGHVSCERQEANGAVMVVAVHNGYSPNFNLLHRRRLFLGDGGDDLRGEDALEPVLGAKLKSFPFALRFHLHPSVHPTIDVVGHDQIVRLELASGAMWGLRVSPGVRLEIAESIYFGTDDDPCPTTQIVVSGESSENGVSVKWALRRDKPR
ncbi:Hepar_II_III_N domain-containing protein [Azospirillaceae bacterium]